MLSKTRGIVLHAVPYNDTYAIIHIYTELFGRTSYLTKLKTGRKKGVSHALFLPLSVLEMDVEHLNTRDIQRIREVKACSLPANISLDPVKNVIALFLAEVLFRTVRMKEPDARLFEYLSDSIRWLELAEDGVANFHMVFLMQLVRCLGVYPNVSTYGPGCFFDMINGVFTSRIPQHCHFLSTEESTVLFRLLKMNYTNMAVFAFSRHERTNIIRAILNYCRLHLSDFPEIRSLSIMQSLFE
jgi:DNA repair protein RecO (recombination protein O)